MCNFTSLGTTTIAADAGQRFEDGLCTEVG